MKDENEICHFIPSEYLQEKATVVLENEKQNLYKVNEFIDIEIEHFGGMAVPGCLTKGDIDIQIRVRKEDFNKVKVRMKNYTEIKREDLWNEGQAIFKGNNGSFLIDYSVTVKGSEYEKYYMGGRDLLIQYPEVLEEYNKLKKSFEGKKYKDYKKEKHLFWKRIFKKYFKFKNVV